jgi:hypothetical protein
VDRLAERSLEQTGRERLVKERRPHPAGQAFMLGTVGQGLR